MLGLDGGGVLSTEAQLGDGHVVQDDVEVFGPLEQLSADQQGHLQEDRSVTFSLSLTPEPSGPINSSTGRSGDVEFRFKLWYLSSLSDELRGVELGHDAPQGLGRR